MANTSIFCLTLDPSHEKIIHKLSYIPVGLGDKKFPNTFLTDKTGLSISQKSLLRRIHPSLLVVEELFR